jgi:hypothetical protein
MKHRPSPCSALLERLRRWLQAPDRDHQYLAEARDLAELERRLRALERSAGGPPVMRS